MREGIGREREVKFRKRAKIMRERGREFITSNECEGGNMYLYKEILMIEKLMKRELIAIDRASVNK